MKRNMDLIRELVFAIESANSHVVASDVKIEGYSQDEIVYHCNLLHDASFIHGETLGTLDSEFDDIFITRLTWEGHEFADAAREDTRWNHVKSMVTSVGGATLPVWLNLLTQFLGNQIGLTGSSTS